MHTLIALIILTPFALIRVWPPTDDFTGDLAALWRKVLTKIRGLYRLQERKRP